MRDFTLYTEGGNQKNLPHIYTIFNGSGFFKGEKLSLFALKNKRNDFILKTIIYLLNHLGE